MGQDAVLKSPPDRKHLRYRQCPSSVDSDGVNDKDLFPQKIRRWTEKNYRTIDI
jgi:hypothetical protein